MSTIFKHYILKVIKFTMIAKIIQQSIYTCTKKSLKGLHKIIHVKQIFFYLKSNIICLVWFSHCPRLRK